MAREAGEQRSGLVGGETALGERVRRKDPDRAEASHREWMPRRNGQGRQEPVGEPEAGVDQRPEQPPIRRRIAAEGRRGVVDRAVQHRGAAPVERMGQRHLGMDPLQAVSAECSAGGDLPERRRSDGERMDRRADVVDRSGKSELLGARAAAGAGGRFVHRDAPTGARQRDRRHQSVRPGTDDDRPTIHGRADDFRPRSAAMRRTVAISAQRTAWRFPQGVA